MRREGVLSCCEEEFLDEVSTSRESVSREKKIVERSSHAIYVCWCDGLCEVQGLFFGYYDRALISR